MTAALIDDQLLGQVLRGRTPRSLASAEMYTTGHWYVRLCQAVMAAGQRTGVFSRPFAQLPPALRHRAMNAILDLPDEIGLISLRQLAPTIGQLRQHHKLNILGIEALATAMHLGAAVHLSAPSPLLEAALRHENLIVTVKRTK
jgi:hypothetical protein